ncbi:unnamed protein product [Closterium sp. NIES-65]|nr:unnamed protein product [Closterium sp. NIES-65]
MPPSGNASLRCLLQQNIIRPQLLPPVCLCPFLQFPPPHTPFHAIANSPLHPSHPLPSLPLPSPSLSAPPIPFPLCPSHPLPSLPLPSPSPYPSHTPPAMLLCDHPIPFRVLPTPLCALPNLPPPPSHMLLLLLKQSNIHPTLPPSHHRTLPSSHHPTIPPSAPIHSHRIPFHQVPGGKALVLDASISGPLAFIAPISLLKVAQNTEWRIGSTSASSEAPQKPPFSSIPALRVSLRYRNTEWKICSTSAPTPSNHSAPPSSTSCAPIRFSFAGSHARYCVLRLGSGSADEDEGITRTYYLLCSCAWGPNQHEGITRTYSLHSLFLSPFSILFSHLRVLSLPNPFSSTPPVLITKCEQTRTRASLAPTHSTPCPDSLSRSLSPGYPLSSMQRIPRSHQVRADEDEGVTCTHSLHSLS